MMNGYERDVMNRLKRMFQDMVVPGHNDVESHTITDCEICQLLDDINQL